MTAKTLAAYHHHPDLMPCQDHPDGCPAPDDGRAFFVSVQSGAKAGFLAGPYTTHTGALVHVEAARQMAEAADPRAPWYAFGTCQAPADLTPVFGLL